MKRNKKRKQNKPRLIDGLPVVDATHSLKLDITKNDVRNSKKADPSNCAAAVACRREYKKDVKVFLTKTYIKEKKHWVRYETPERISREIIAFDRGSNFVPDIYELKAPAVSNTLAYQRTQKKSGPRLKKGESKRPHHMTKEVRGYRENMR